MFKWQFIKNINVNEYKLKVHYADYSQKYVVEVETKA